MSFWQQGQLSAFLENPRIEVIEAPSTMLATGAQNQTSTRVS
jgi:hypothetical protein